MGSREASLWISTTEAKGESHFTVIPAKAGIQCLLPRPDRAKALDASFRWHDGREMPIGWTAGAQREAHDP
jgi:hypothetical protein